MAIVFTSWQSWFKLPIPLTPLRKRRGVIPRSARNDMSAALSSLPSRHSRADGKPQRGQEGQHHANRFHIMAIMVQIAHHPNHLALREAATHHCVML